MRSIIWYYQIKSLIPRRLQISLRRAVADKKKKRNHSVWPIRSEAARAPENWQGWPNDKKFALVLTHDVDTSKGYDQCESLKQIEERLGFSSSFNFVPEGYKVSRAVRSRLAASGFEVGVHGLTHDARIFVQRKRFDSAAPRINAYLKDWGAVGFNAPSMVSNLEWISELAIEYDSSTFDTDPYEPSPDGVATIFPFIFKNNHGSRSYVELPYTLPQDHSLFIILKERDIEVWKKKLSWIVSNGGMALLNTHPDYMHFGGGRRRFEEYPLEFYTSFLEHIKTEYAGQYWHVLPREMALFWKTKIKGPVIKTDQGATAILPRVRPKRVWIDLDNTPHVPFFIPIIKELEKRGVRVLLTARDAFQVCELASQSGLNFKKIGRHWGRRKIMKIVGWLQRAMWLAPFALKNRPDLALSHGSRSQILISRFLGIPTVMITDYEHSRYPPLAIPDWEISPDVIPAAALPSHKVLKYHGLKEDVYAPFFKPDPAILKDLGLNNDDLIITVRPPATEAHYHNPESDGIFQELMRHILNHPQAKTVLLPRNRRQGSSILMKNPSWFSKMRVIIPSKALDGLNLIYFSDLVVSGGGTMNREAAALGIPVYSIFRGRLGEVDRHLEAEGRLVMISTPDEVATKVKLVKRDRSFRYNAGERPALLQIVNHVEAILGQSKRRVGRKSS
jgi:hypothetical protein